MTATPSLGYTMPWWHSYYHQYYGPPSYYEGTPAYSEYQQQQQRWLAAAESREGERSSAHTTSQATPVATRDNASAARGARTLSRNSTTSSRSSRSDSVTSESSDESAVPEMRNVHKIQRRLQVLRNDAHFKAYQREKGVLSRKPSTTLLSNTMKRRLKNTQATVAPRADRQPCVRRDE